MVVMIYCNRSSSSSLALARGFLYAFFVVVQPVFGIYYSIVFALVEGLKSGFL